MKQIPLKKYWKQRFGFAFLPIVLAGISQTVCSKTVDIVSQSGYQEVRGPIAQVRIVDRDTGQVLPVYRYQGDYWVAGRPDARYGISIFANTHPAYGRVEAVISVDGVNVITGQTAAKQQTGYVLSAGQWHTITGWRKNDNEVAAFHFTTLPDSYAARTGRPDNVGVIGIALYLEKAAPKIVRPWHRAQSKAEENKGREQQEGADMSAEPMPHAAATPERNAPSMRARQDNARLGTGHGPRENSAVTYTTFERRSPTSDQVVTIRYDSYKNLVAMGVIPRQTWRNPERPQAFPQEQVRQYVPDPAVH